MPEDNGFANFLLSMPTESEDDHSDAQREAFQPDRSEHYKPLEMNSLCNKRGSVLFADTEFPKISHDAPLLPFFRCPANRVTVTGRFYQEAATIERTMRIAAFMHDPINSASRRKQEPRKSIENF
ncbi:MAG: hypothetical protein FWF99_07930 [Desulfovibrionaceae bacterium]|nr:hypothetical protein [Desulfovibrionaceae bacterium]